MCCQQYRSAKCKDQGKDFIFSRKFPVLKCKKYHNHYRRRILQNSCNSRIGIFHHPAIPITPYTSILSTCRLFFQIRNIPSFCTIYALVNNMIPAMIRRTFTIHVAVTPLYSNVYFPNTPAIPHKNPPAMVSAVPLTVSFRSNRSVRFSCAVLFFVVCGFPFVIFPCIPLFCLVCLFYCIL